METSSPPQRARAHHGALPSPQVTNAQFPEQMETLRPCTQLYISVDAPTATELKAVDRPLFADFWERFLKCVDLLREKHPACKCSPRRPTPLPTGVDLLREKRQRTVFRLTLVNGWNTEQLDECVWLPRWPLMTTDDH